MGHDLPTRNRPESFLCEDILQRRILQREIGGPPFEAAVLLCECVQPLTLGRLQAPLRGVPRVVRRGPDAVLRQTTLTARPASAAWRMDTICVSVKVDWRRGTAWLRVAILPERSPDGPFQIRGSVRSHLRVVSIGLGRGRRRDERYFV